MEMAPLILGASLLSRACSRGGELDAAAKGFRKRVTSDFEACFSSTAYMAMCHIWLLS